jgi:hypothetical protein
MGVGESGQPIIFLDFGGEKSKSKKISVQPSHPDRPPM